MSQRMTSGTTAALIAAIAAGCSHAPLPSPSEAVTRQARTVSDPLVSCADLPGTFDAPLPAHLEKPPAQLGIYELDPGESQQMERLFLALGYVTIPVGGPGVERTTERLDFVAGWLTGREEEPLEHDAYWSTVTDPDGKSIPVRRVRQYRALVMAEDPETRAHTILVERVPCSPTMRAEPAEALWLSSRGAEAAELDGATITLRSDRIELRALDFEVRTLELSSSSSTCSGDLRVTADDAVRSALDLHVRIRIERVASCGG
jgi:hypothetical protein